MEKEYFLVSKPNRCFYCLHESYSEHQSHFVAHFFMKDNKMGQTLLLPLPISFSIIGRPLGIV
jgi:hypothetical protein